MRPDGERLYGQTPKLPLWPTPSLEGNTINGSIPLGRFAGISVSAHWSAGLIAIVIGSTLHGLFGLHAAVIGTIAFLISILLHEFGHALTARRFGVDTESIQLWALGGVARLSREPSSPKAEGWIAAAGPLTSVAIAVASLSAWWALGADASNSEFVALLAWLGFTNAALAIFNLLPGAPLDGGRIVKAVRWAMHGNRYRAMREAGRAGSVLGWTLAALGLGLMLRGESGFVLMAVGVFVAMNARVEMAVARVAERLDGVKVRDLTWFGVAAAGTDMDADSMLWDRRRLGMAGGVAVTDSFGRPQGIVLEDEMWAIPANQRPWVMLTQLMTPVDRIARATPDENLTDVLPRLNPANPVVTVWQNGKLVGMVPPKKLRERLSGASGV
jgi:Zn-dependent protease